MLKIHIYIFALIKEGNDLESVMLQALKTKFKKATICSIVE